MQSSQKWIETFQANWKAKFEIINSHIKEFCNEMGFPVAAAVHPIYGGGLFQYYKMRPEELEGLIEKLFQDYNQKIDRLNQDLQSNKNNAQEISEKNSKRLLIFIKN
ncbi:MAG: hypothetical protein HWD61_04570 [Parachlamydiaceae bacterium]|nr:MAG: hypothetical protein HWD61_04570 [Parachlamydiaceae bacterium]